MARKTFKIVDLIKKVNDFNANSADDAVARREHGNDMLTEILMAAGVYSGFAYLTGKDIRGKATTKGINTDEDGFFLDGEARFKNTDGTRIKFFTSSKLD